MSKQSGPKSWEERLVVEGVNFKGYGIVPKFAMRDRDLSAKTKGIYAYFCSMSGSGDSSFPSLETILKHLGMGEYAYYENRRPLIEQGYLEVLSEKRDGGLYGTNTYIIVSNPKKFSDTAPQNNWQEKAYSTIEHEGLKKLGYGTIPKSVMQDPRLDIYAKALYAYFASYAGNGRTALPAVPNILKELSISKATYQGRMKKLQNLGYILVRQDNWSGQKAGFGRNRYILAEFPEKVSRPTDSGTVHSGTVNSEPVVSEGVEWDTVNSEAANSQTVIAETVHSKTDGSGYINNIFTIKNSSYIKNTDQSIREPLPEWMDGYDAEEDDFEKKLKENVNYDDIATMFPKEAERYKEMVLLMITACEIPGPTVRIGKTEISKEKVKERFLNLTLEHLEYVLLALDRQRGKIRNIRAYYLTALFHAPETMDAYMKNLVRENQEMHE